MKKVRLIIGIFLIYNFALNSQSVVLNEISQGTTGSKEYIELVVAWTPSCVATTPCVDLRNWYIDDNNGTFGSGSGVGIAPGCVRLTNNTFWSCIPVGTIILIYNNVDLNGSVPAQDLSITDGNCKLVIPINNTTLFQYHATLPNSGSPSYPTSGFVPGGDWVTISMANGDDSFQIRNSTGSMVNAISWGNNTLNNIIYLGAASQSGLVASMENSVNNVSTNSLNWTSSPVGINETPGFPNSTANATWINSMNNSCTAITPLVATASFTNAGCSCTGAASVSASGSIPNYSYSWAPTGGNAAIATGLCAGSYTCTITSAMGCVITKTIVINSASSINSPIIITPVTCNGSNDGKATVNAAGGVAPYTYQWLPSGGSSASAVGLSPGNYTVIVTDATNCNTQNVATISEPVALTATTLLNNTTCNGGANGAASISVNGGSTPYTYQWLPSGGSSASATGLSPGSYTCIVKDLNNCFISKTLTISAIQPSVSVSNYSVCTNQTPTVTASVSGGTAPYTYNWNNGFSNNQTFLAPSATANYSLIVTDNLGCTSQQAISQVYIYPIATLSITASNGICLGNSTILSASISNLNFPATYNWSPEPAATQTILVSPAQTTNYSVAVSIGGACPQNLHASKQLTVTPSPTITYSNSLLSGCEPFCVNFYDMSSQLNNPIISWDWSFSNGVTSNNQNPKICFNSAGSYTGTYTITNSYGCTVTLSNPIQIEVYPNPTADFNADKFEISEFDSIVAFIDQSSKNTTYWEWNFAWQGTSFLQNPTHGFNAIGSYPVNLIVKNNEGCSDEITKIITVKPEFTFYAPNTFTPNGDDKNDLFLPLGNGWNTQHYHLWIFDKWGNILFQTEEYNKGWDGMVNKQLQKQDVYIWKAEVVDVAENTHVYSGHLSLLH